MFFQPVYDEEYNVIDMKDLSHFDSNITNLSNWIDKISFSYTNDEIHRYNKLLENDKAKAFQCDMCKLYYIKLVSRIPKNPTELDLYCPKCRNIMRRKLKKKEDK